jgi:hypothetical protein
LLGLNDSGDADEQECWNERSKKERAKALTHGIDPPVREDDQERSGNTGARIRRPATPGNGAKRNSRTRTE